MKKVTIIGAGVGGIATAIYLAREGYEVAIYEKNALPGGRCGNIVRDGHRFDVGATLLMMTDVYRSIYRDFGYELEDLMELIRMDPIYELRFGEGEKLRISADMHQLKREIEKIEPGCYGRFLNYMNESYRSYELSMKNIINRNYFNLFQFFNPRQIYLLNKMKAFGNHYRRTGRFFSSEKLRIAFSFQNIYVGQNPLKASAIFSMLPFLELTDGVWFPKGGMNEITNSLVKIAGSNNVTFHYKSPVSKIRVRNGKAEGIELVDGRFIGAEIIIANSDLPYVYNDLLPDGRTAQRIRRLQYTCSAFVFHWGMDTLIPDLEQHNVFVSPDYGKNIKAVFDDLVVPAEPSFYLHSPARYDSSAAPAGQDSITVIIPVGHMNNKKDIDWESLKDQVKESVLHRLAKEGFHDFEDHIKFESCYTPSSWKSAFNLTHGAIFGSLNHNIYQMGWFRPHNRHKKYRNLFFVGGSTHPGNGVPMCLISARLTAEKIMKYHS